MRKKSFCRHFLVLTFANGSQFDHCQPSPFERNWQQTPLNFGDEKCFGHGFSDCNLLNLRRWKSVRIPAIDAHSDLTLHKFVDLSFFDVMFSSKEVPLDFLDTNQNGEFWQLDSFEKGLYEELKTVKWEGLTPEESDHWMSDSSDQPANGRDEGSSSSIWGEYSTTTGEENAEDRDTDNSGYILVGHPSGSQQQPTRPFVSDWHNWSSVRNLCATLPQKCTFRRLSFYRKRNGKCRYEFIVLIQVDNVTSFVDQISNCINKAQSIPEKRAYIDLYQEIEFEVDLEVLQHLVEISKSINCVGRRLVVQFGDDHSTDTFALTKQTPFSLYNRGNFCSSSNSPSISISNALTLNFANNNYRSDEEKSEASEFDVEMEEIIDRDENQNVTVKQRHKAEREQDLTNNNNNNNNGGGMGILWKNDRKNSRKMVKHLFTISTSYPQQPAELLQLVEGHRNNEKMAGQDVIRNAMCGEENSRDGGTSGRRKGGKTLGQKFIGTLWRKLSTKHERS